MKNVLLINTGKNNINKIHVMTYRGLLGVRDIALTPRQQTARRPRSFTATGRAHAACYWYMPIFVYFISFTAC